MTVIVGANVPVSTTCHYSHATCETATITCLEQCWDSLMTCTIHTQLSMMSSFTTDGNTTNSLKSLSGDLTKCNKKKPHN